MIINPTIMAGLNDKAPSLAKQAKQKAKEKTEEALKDIRYKIEHLGED
jgi:hypothetical protein